MSDAPEDPATAEPPAQAEIPAQAQAEAATPPAQGQACQPIAAPPVQPRVYRMANPVLFMGRKLPRASTWERGFWAFLLAGCVSVLILAGVVLDPDTRGIGTHEQLGFPPCGFVQMFGGPCPSCGFTTTFTLAAHFRPVDALVNQPFGLFLFTLTVAAVVVLPLAILKAISLMVLTERWPWWRIGLCLLLAWLACWAYKWQALGL